MTDAPSLRADSILTPFVPRLSVEWQSRFGDSTWAEIDGSMVFIDLSGFTALSERLSRLGREGAEEITRVIDETFADLLQAAYRRGGGLLKFGGDALLLFFEDDEHAPRACRAAYEMRACLRDRGPAVTAAGKATLRMSTGVHSGRFHFFLVGGAHRELLVTGPSATCVVDMEGAASAGQIVISAATAAQLPAAAVGREAAPGVLLRVPPECAEFDVPLVRTDDVEEMIPVALRAAIASGVTEPEHRLAAVAFVHFDGVDAMVRDDGPAAVAERLDAMVRSLQDAIGQHDLCFLSSDLDHDGGKVIVTAGVPRSHEDDEDRLLRAVVSAVHATTAIPLRAGLHRGTLFAGAIGPAYRRTFTVMGDTVNTAARVMAHAKAGQILATPDLLARSTLAVRRTDLPPFAAKGKAAALHAAAVLSVERAASEPQAAEDVPLVGRDPLIDEALSSLADANSLELRGPAGVGKSRLLREIARRLEQPKTFLITDAHASGAPLQPLAGLLRTALGLDEGADADALRAACSRTRSDADGAFLGRALGLPLDETNAADLSPQQLRSMTNRVLASVLDDANLLSGTWIVHDAQWLDDDSRSFLNHLATRVRPDGWTLLCASRAGGRVPGAAQVEVPPLHPEDAERLAMLIGAGRVTPNLVRTLCGLAEGNPLFLIELTRHAATSGTTELPDTVENVAAAAIDRLPTAARRQLRELAVLGDRIPMDLATAVVGDIELGDLVDFVEWERGQLRFRQHVYQEAAYAGLSYRERRRLHSTAADRLLDDRDADRHTLVRHLHAAQRWDETWHTASSVGWQAATSLAVQQAIELFARADEAAMNLSPRPAGHAAVVAELGRFHSVTGSPALAKKLFARARRLAGQDDIESLLRVFVVEAVLRTSLGELTSAVRWSNRGLRLIEKLAEPPPSVSMQKVRLLQQRGIVEVNRAATAKAEADFRSSLAVATEIGDLPGQAHAYNWLVQICRLTRAGDAEHYAERAIALYREAGAEWAVGNVLSNLGNYLRAVGRWDEAVAAFDEAADRLNAVDAMLGVAVVANNAGELLADQGRWDEALGKFETAERTLAAMGHVYAHVASGGLSRVRACLGDHDAAEPALEVAEAALRAAGLVSYAAEAGLRRAESMLLRGAVAGVDELLEANTGIVDGPVGLPGRLRALKAAMGGDQATAEQVLRSLFDAPEVAESPFERGCTWAALAHVTGDEDAAHRAKEIFAKLGVVRPPPLPPLDRGGAPPRETT